MYNDAVGDVPSSSSLKVVDVSSESPARDRNYAVGERHGRWVPLPDDVLVSEYAAGASVNALAAKYGAARSTIERRLTRRGIILRGLTDANRMSMAVRSPGENARNTAAAHAASRGRKATIEERCRTALTKERRQSHVSPAEMLLAEWLADLGPVPQKAIGPYNVDLAIDPVAVEIFGGGWHASGRHAARTPKRFRYLFDAGWNVLVIWVDRRNHPLGVDAADEVRTFAEESRRDPAFRRQHRVIWGDGKPAPARGLNLDQLA